MALELEFETRDAFPLKASATVVLNRYGQVDGGLPMATPECASMGALEGELKLMERQISEIRREAKRRFIAAGISS